MEFTKYLESISIILACWSAIAALEAWKREFIGKRKIELAENLLAKFHEVCDAISFIRNPFSSTKEGNTRKKEEHETEDETKLLNRAYIVYERYEKKKNVFIEFSTIKYKFMASFGKETEKIFNDTYTILNRILVSAQMLGTHYWVKYNSFGMNEEELEKFKKEKHNHEKIFWEGLTKDDEVKNQLSEILNSIEQIVNPCFEDTSTIYRLMTKKITIFKNKK